MTDWADERQDPPDIVIPRHVVEKAQAIVRSRYREVGEHGILEIMARLDWHDAASYSDRGTLQLSGLDDLKTVALAAAMVAYLAAKGRR